MNFKKIVNKRIGDDELTLGLPNAKQNFLGNTISYNGVMGLRRQANVGDHLTIHQLIQTIVETVRY